MPLSDAQNILTNIKYNHTSKRIFIVESFNWLLIDKRIKMDCPFCGRKKEDIQIITYSKNYHELRCPKCKCTFIGTSKQELIDRWNCRF